MALSTHAELVERNQSSTVHVDIERSLMTTKSMRMMPRTQDFHEGCHRHIRPSLRSHAGTHVAIITDEGTFGTHHSTSADLIPIMVVYLHVHEADSTATTPSQTPHSTEWLISLLQTYYPRHNTPR
jgi:hypothetical protein